MYQHTVAVRYAETDAMRVVHHSRYLPWLEEARIAFLGHCGLSYAKAEAEDMHFSVVEVHMRYLRSCKFGDNVHIMVTLEQLGSRGLSFGYKGYVQNQLMFEASSKHICQTSAGQIFKIPTEVFALLQTQITP